MLYQPFGPDDGDTASSTVATRRLPNRANASSNLPIFVAGLPDPDRYDSLRRLMRRLTLKTDSGQS